LAVRINLQFEVDFRTALGLGEFPPISEFRFEVEVHPEASERTLWTGAREYNPDFVTVDRDETHLVIEVKMDKEMASVPLKGARQVGDLGLCRAHGRAPRSSS